jgi:hypothetical protein
MRIPALVILATVTSLTSSPTLAQAYSPDYPVCLQYYRWGGSDINCAYTSLEQCGMTASGLSAQCITNPYFANAQMPRGPRYPQSRRAY